MDKPIEIIKKPRLQLVTLLDSLTLEQLNFIPKGFNNNILWNAGHMVSAQLGICYIRGSVPPGNDEFFNTYRSGTKPERTYTAGDVAQVKEMLISSIDQLAIDIPNGIFNNYTTWSTRYGVEINSIETAVSFLPFHEGIHTGAIMAIKRLQENQ